MLLAQRCVGTWRQVSGAFVAEGVQSAVKRFCSSNITPVGTEESLEQIRSRIFGTYIGNGLRSGRKVLRKNLIGDKIASYYPEPVAKYDPMFVDMNIERKKLKLDKLRRRGKAPPKKGQGKRASKKR